MLSPGTDEAVFCCSGGGELCEYNRVFVFVSRSFGRCCTEDEGISCWRTGTGFRGILIITTCVASPSASAPLLPKLLLCNGEKLEWIGDHDLSLLLPFCFIMSPETPTRLPRKTLGTGGTGFVSTYRIRYRFRSRIRASTFASTSASAKTIVLGGVNEGSKKMGCVGES